MAQSIYITLTIAGTDTGPFSLFSNADAYFSPFEIGVSKASLEAGYLSSAVPDAATIIRVQSTSTLCTNFIDLPISGLTTTTTTSTSSTTTTSTTTVPVYNLFWSINNAPGGNLKVYPTSTPESPIVNQNTISNSSSFVTLSPGVSYTIKGSWTSGSGNVIKFRVCDLDNAPLELYLSPDITISSPSDTYVFTLPLVPNTLNLSVALRSGGITPPACPIP